MSLALAVERMVTGLAGCCAATRMRAEDLKFVWSCEQVENWGRVCWLHLFSFLGMKVKCLCDFCSTEV